MQTYKRFTAAENKLAYAQSFSRLTTGHFPEHPRARGHLIGHTSSVLQSFVRHRQSTARHRAGV